MIKAFKTWLSSRHASRTKQSALREAQEFRARMYIALRDAEARGDTRDIGQFTLWLRKATADVIRLEIGR